MINLDNIEKYRENNRIEAKKALGGLPKSIWETYSAFANTLGGVILLGVEEYKDKSFHPITLPSPHLLIDEFIGLLNNKNKVSANILSSRHIQIIKSENTCFIAIFVPRASRFDRPVYIDNDPILGTYKRNGEGDYRATKDEILSMMKDSQKFSFDNKILEHIYFKKDSLDFFKTVYNFDTSNTVAELLILGEYNDIKTKFPEFELSIFDKKPTIFKGNLLDFYLKLSDIFKTIAQNEETYFCLQEALLNAIINTDYEKNGKIEVRITASHISFTNSGIFNANLDDAKKGWVCEPRNPIIKKLFDCICTHNFIVGGIPYIHMIWQKNGWSAPRFEEKADSTTLKLYFYNIDTFNNDIPGTFAAETVIDYLTEHIYADSKELASTLNKSCINDLLSKLMESGVIIAINRNGNILYKLKD